MRKLVDEAIQPFQMVSNLNEALRILAVAPWEAETGSSGGAKRR